jgi:hypothetical protein
LVYEAADAVHMARTTIWKMSLYGVEFKGDAGHMPAESTIYVFTAARDATEANRFIEAIAG